MKKGKREVESSKGFKVVNRNAFGFMRGSVIPATVHM